MTVAAGVLTEKPNVLTEKPRVASIDIMRGIVMVIMALDHVRDFIHQGGFVYNATDLNTTTPVLFFTRWITHFCAPTFVFLAGTSIYISLRRKTKKEVTLFLLSRGLWLILLDVVVMRFIFFFNFYFDVTVFQVIWVIGASMICMALLIHFSYPVILITGLVITLGHNLAGSIQLQPGDPFFVTWSFLYQTGFLSIANGKNALVFYPLIPWLGIMVLGYCLGKLYSTGFDAQKRQKLLLIIGCSSIALFIVLRLINFYGDPAPWSAQKNAVYTFMSFINTTKYPVSLLFTLMTLGPVLVLLSWMEKLNSNSLNPFIVFGRVPLFYYLLHFFLAHIVALFLMMQKTGKSLSDIDFHFDKSFGGITPDDGYTLPWAYVAWISIVLFLYPLCKWYNRYKSTHHQWWLSYL